MKNQNIVIALTLLFILMTSVYGVNKPKQEYYAIRVYHCKDVNQEKQMDSFLKNVFIPTLKRYNINRTGVFKPIANDTAGIKKIFVFIPFKNVNDLAELSTKMDVDKFYTSAGNSFVTAPYNNPPYMRMETIFLKSFSDMPIARKPTLQSPAEERVYELRSYESATERLYRKKVQMFNKGGEIKLFERLGFNAVFYGEVIAGPRMPNLMYMTTFENMKDRDAHWKSFVDDPEWKLLAPMPEYANTVSKNEITLMRPTNYSQL